jgi:hypothetical protein
MNPPVYPTLSAATERAYSGKGGGRIVSGSPYQRRLQTMVTLLVLTLILEGLLRRLVPALSLPIFFLKDLLALLTGVLLLFGKPPRSARSILGLQASVFILISPCVIATALHDPKLALFGLKQYDLFPFAGAALCAAFLPGRREALLSFCRMVAWSIIPTTLVAMLQQRLPADHWLNKSPDGESLQRFSAGGQLRVSSTFSFVSQFCMYLNAYTGYLGIVAYVAWLREHGLKALRNLLLLIPFYLLSAYSTGSRQAVLGGALILALSVIVLGAGRGRKFLPALLLAGTIGFLVLGGLRLLHPESFKAYDARTASVDEVDTRGSTGAAVARVSKGLSNWINEAISGPVFGNGLGVMSNGTEKLSNYAAVIRSEGFWTETDPATVVYEGGIYLMVVWYGMRAGVILWGLFSTLAIRNPFFAAAAAFCWGPLVIIGALGTLSIQPPLSIWWWLDFALILCLREFDRESRLPRMNHHARNLREPSRPV